MIKGTLCNDLAVDMIDNTQKRQEIFNQMDEIIKRDQFYFFKKNLNEIETANAQRRDNKIDFEEANKYNKSTMR